MNLLNKYNQLREAAGSTLYTSPGTGYSARVIQKNGKHTTKFFKDGAHLKHSDYTGKDENDAHEFAREEMEFRNKEKSESTIQERILEPQGHKETADPISDDSREEGRKKKMMGNRTPMEIIAKILAGR